MKKLWSNAIHLLLIAAALGAARTAHAQTATPSTPPAGQVVNVQPPGTLKVSRRRGDKPADATIGTEVHRGDVLILAEGARASISCPNIPNPLVINKRSQSYPCTTAAKFKSSKYGPIPSQRGTDTAESAFPVIILPRATRILNPRPTLRWSPVAKTATGGTTTDTVYRVSILIDGMKPVWSVDGVKNTEMPYPADKPPLVPGDYLLLVSTGEGESDDEQTAGRGFTVLPTCAGRRPRVGRKAPCLEQQVRDEERRIRNFNLPDDSKRLLVAELYASKGLYAEAIEAMEKVSATVKAPAVKRRLGDLYTSIGLSREAERFYAEALSIYRTSNDPEAQALTLRSLALTYENLGVFDQARASYDEAIEVYEKLGDPAAVEELKRLRAKLGGPK